MYARTELLLRMETARASALPANVQHVERVLGGGEGVVEVVRCAPESDALL